MGLLRDENSNLKNNSEQNKMDEGFPSTQAFADLEETFAFDAGDQDLGAEKQEELAATMAFDELPTEEEEEEKVILKKQNVDSKPVSIPAEILKVKSPKKNLKKANDLAESEKDVKSSEI